MIELRATVSLRNKVIERLHKQIKKLETECDCLRKTQAAELLDSYQSLQEDYSILRARIKELEAEQASIMNALRLSVVAMRAPLDDWKGELERQALDAIALAMEQAK